MFNLDKFSLTLLSPVPLDISEGLVLDESFLTVVKSEKELVKVKSGLGGEVLISENLNSLYSLDLIYLPNAKANIILEGLVTIGTQFGMLIQCPFPKYKGVASECRVVKRPDLALRTTGLDDTAWSIIMSDYIGKFIPT